MSRRAEGLLVKIFCGVVSGDLVTIDAGGRAPLHHECGVFMGSIDARLRIGRRKAAYRITEDHGWSVDRIEGQPGLAHVTQPGSHALKHGIPAIMALLYPRDTLQLWRPGDRWPDVRLVCDSAGLAHAASCACGHCGTDSPWQRRRAAEEGWDL